MPTFPNVFHKDIIDSMTNFKDQVRLTVNSNYAGVACDKKFKRAFENNITDIYICSCLLITM